MRRIAIVCVMGALAALSGCPGPIVPPPDTGSDAAPIDDDAFAAPPDAFVPLATAQCRPCRRHADCGEGTLCLPLGTRELACGHPCESDVDCDALPVPSRCVEAIAGMPLQCQPLEDTCLLVEAGRPCADDDDCGGTFDRCLSTDGLSPRCTTSCRTDADCPIGMRRCADIAGEGRVCVVDRTDPTARCEALVASDRATACHADRSCPPGSTCHGEGALALCLGAPPCGVGTVERASGEARVCVPHLDTADPWNDVWADCECVLTDEGSLFDEAITLADRSRCELRFRSEHLDRYEPTLSHDRFRLSFTDRVHQGWLAVPRFADRVERSLDEAGTAERLEFLAIAADLTPRRLEHVASVDFEDALVDLVASAGGTFDPSARRAELEAIDLRVQAALRPVLDATRVALEARTEALSTLSDTQRTTAFAEPSGLFLPTVDDVRPVTAASVQGLLLGDVDVSAMASGAIEIARSLDRDTLTALVGSVGSIVIDTPAGRVAIGGPGDDRYEGAAWERVLVLVELGGDDVYRVPVGATTSVDHGVSVVIDLGGDDDYGYEPVPVALDTADDGTLRPPSDGAGRVAPASGQGPSSRSQIARQGAGRLGVGMLFDLGSGRDRYASLRMSQGYGALGVGVLVDAGGLDTYVSEAGSQGAASFGIGLLEDLGGGSDRYEAYASSQGFGYARGVGVLYDEGGDDDYVASPHDVLYWSPQIPGGSNSSFCQGAGFGRRADFGDGVYMSGGLGVLRDRAGHDTYTAAVFAQGTGYWFGTGLLLDAAGDDHYDAEWYAQGSDAHYAIAALIDRGGDDVYDETASRYSGVLGSGHDFSSAWLLELGGDDRYRFVGRSGGTGNAGGAGFFVDTSGTDTYVAEGTFTVGNASIETPGDALRTITGTVGIFVERGGTDAYTRDPIAPIGNDASWSQEVHADENEHGAGVDRASGSVGIAGL
ncbi:MAG: TonB-dependent receptor [Deltaproteobacteria bacterium]|nr:TonB-dependent receptor [Deltaproteobacteria bacterium]